MTDLGTFGGLSSVAKDVNDRGQVVGWSGIVPGADERRAFLWQGGRLINLGTLPGTRCSTADAINARGQVIGTSSNLANASAGRSFMWQNSRMTDLGTLPGFPESWATDINARGEIVGFTSDNPSDREHAFRWANGTMLTQ
jgi:probable HAF family extracellular repeat protein